jgi:membrane-associated phospholipid phosphatase
VTRSTRRVQLTVAATAFVGFLVVLEQVMVDGPLVDLDHHLADVYGHGRLGHARTAAQLTGNGRLVRVARVVAPLGDARLLLVAIGVLAALVFRQQRRREALFLVTVAVGGIVLDLSARLVIGHLRPDLPFPYGAMGRYGLPSGHALDAASCYGAMVVVMWGQLNRAVRVVVTAGAAGLVACISYSRVVVMAHYLTDVVAGATLGLAWLLAVAVAFSLPRDDDGLSPLA